jgi:hypothetical protein
MPGDFRDPISGDNLREGLVEFTVVFTGVMPGISEILEGVRVKMDGFWIDGGPV